MVAALVKITICIVCFLITPLIGTVSVLQHVIQPIGMIQIEQNHSQAPRLKRAFNIFSHREHHYMVIVVTNLAQNIQPFLPLFLLPLDPFKMKRGKCEHECNQHGKSQNNRKAIIYITKWAVSRQLLHQAISGKSRVSQGHF